MISTASGWVIGKWSSRAREARPQTDGEHECVTGSDICGQKSPISPESIVHLYVMGNMGLSDGHIFCHVEPLHLQEILFLIYQCLFGNPDWDLHDNGFLLAIALKQNHDFLAKVFCY